MPTAEIITIGTELLLGEKVDTNTHYIARLLRDEGIDLYRTSTIGDNKERIAQIIKEGLTRSDIIITTGGLGPTVDDPTREAIALAFNVKTTFRKDLWNQIEERFKLRGKEPTENNKRMAYIPDGAIPVENILGTAPAFIMETKNHAVISLPGVPREMENLMETKILPYLRQRFNLTDIITTRILHTSGIGESNIDFLIGDLEKLRNPTVGLAAHAGQVDIRIAAKAKDRLEANAMIAKIETQIRQRLDKFIYGVDDDTLESVSLNKLATKNLSLILLEAGLGGYMIDRLSNNPVFAKGKVLPTAPDVSVIIETFNEFAKGIDNKKSVIMGVFYYPGEDKQNLAVVISKSGSISISHQIYGGPPKMGHEWALNVSLDLLRKV